MRELKINKIYRHFKGDKYIVLAISKPVTTRYVYDCKEICLVPVVAIHTEKPTEIPIYYDFTCDSRIHPKVFESEELVIYMALYDDFKIYARPYNMFMSKVDKEKHEDTKQEYRFEEID